MKDKQVLVIGGTGSWGEILIKKLLAKEVGVIRVLARNESKLFYLKQKYMDQPVQIVLGDIRDKERLLNACKGCDIVYHLAALKHVSLCEESPTEAILTNVLGTRNVIDCAIASNVKKVIYTSTDKVVDANGTYGCTKLLAEKLMLRANESSNTTKFIIFRSGNLLGSEGSVITLFKKQIEKRGVVHLTDKQMSRFFVSISKASDLLIEASVCGVGGEIFITTMPAIKIYDIAKYMLAKYGRDESNIQMIGLRRGEKLSERLATKEEQETIYKVSKELYVIEKNETHSRIRNEIVTWENDLLIESGNATISYKKVEEFLTKENM